VDLDIANLRKSVESVSVLGHTDKLRISGVRYIKNNQSISILGRDISVISGNKDGARIINVFKLTAGSGIGSMSYFRRVLRVGYVNNGNRVCAGSRDIGVIAIHKNIFGIIKIACGTAIAGVNDLSSDCWIFRISYVDDDQGVRSVCSDISIFTSDINAGWYIKMINPGLVADAAFIRGASRVSNINDIQGIVPPGSNIGVVSGNIDVISAMEVIKSANAVCGLRDHVRISGVGYVNNRHAVILARRRT